MSLVSSSRSAFALAASVAFLCACQGNGNLVSQSALPNTGSNVLHHHTTSTKIQHVVIIIQENRSFNNLFMNYPGATTLAFGYNTKNQLIKLKPVTLATTWDLEHDALGFVRSCHGTGSIPGTNCQMNGFNLELSNCGVGSEPKCPNANPPYSYVPRKEVQPYWDMASQYVLADQMFASDFDVSSFESHQYIIAGVNPSASVNYPDGLWGCTGGPGDMIAILGPNRKFKGSGAEQPCWDPTTLGDELDAAKLPWAFYATNVKGAGSFACNPTGLGVNAGKGRTGLWSSYQAIRHICYGPDWNNVIGPPSQFFTDIAAGKLGAVTWITPTYANSDHGGSGSKTGPAWVASLVNAIGESQFWDTTAIFIFWDDSGGWYDPVAPPYADNDGLGFRLPLLIISAYAKQGYVSHVPYEHGSILKFTEDQFGLARLGASDTRANSPESDAFNLSAPPRAFTPITSPYSRSYFMHQPEDQRAPDND